MIFLFGRDHLSHHLQPYNRDDQRDDEKQAPERGGFVKENNAQKHRYHRADTENTFTFHLAQTKGKARFKAAGNDQDYPTHTAVCPVYSTHTAVPLQVTISMLELEPTVS